MPEVFIQGGEGKLQAKYSPSEEEKPNIAIVLHPNPKHGGTMDSKVNYAAFKVMKDNGFSTLRINFRGVGKSDGAFTEGEGELNDASVSLDWLQKKNEDFKSCWIVGFSFGAWIGFQTLMRRPEVDGLILIAPPVNLYDFNFLSPCPIKTLIIKADQDEIVKKVESRIGSMDELRSIYARSFNKVTRNNNAADLIGSIKLEFVDWDKRRPATEIFSEMQRLTSDIPGIKVEFIKSKDGPASGKPIQLEFSSYDFSLVPPAIKKVREIMNNQGGYIGIEDDLPLPGIEWQIAVDRALAARYGADIALLGQSVKLIASGIKVTDYRPDDNDDEVDVVVRYPIDDRHLDQLNELRISTNVGMIPVKNFITVEPAPKSGSIARVDSRRTTTLRADVAEGVLPDTQLKELIRLLKPLASGSQVYIKFKGEDKEKREAMQFLIGAFLTALLLMTLILVTQFNNIYQSLIVLSAIVFSTTGVLLGLLITSQPFGIVMVGLGIIALGGIVVNNNIVLIDTYNRMKKNGLNPYDAALETGRRRLRPVFLTAFTTVLGLMPMVLAMNIDLVNRNISFGAPSTQWWTQLASAIAGGLTFATVLTLILTPCLLLLGEEIWGKLSLTKEYAYRILLFFKKYYKK